MNKKKVLVIVIGVLSVWIVFGNVMFSLQEGKGISEADVALGREVKESFLDWQTIVDKVPELGGKEPRQDLIFRGETGKVIKITITPESSSLWWVVRSTGESNPFRSFSATILFYENETDLQEQIRIMSLIEFEVREGDVTVGFLEENVSQLVPGRPGTRITAFAARQRLWVEFVVSTDLEVEPFAERAELEALIELVEERLLEFDFND